MSAGIVMEWDAAGVGIPLGYDFPCNDKNNTLSGIK